MAQPFASDAASSVTKRAGFDATEIVQSESEPVSNEWNFTTYPSRPVTLINIPEPISVTTGFVYNFYTKDERTNSAGVLDVVNLNDTSQENIQLAKLDKYPRYSLINISAAEFTDPDEFLEGIASTLTISEMRDQLMFEGAVASAYFSGINLKDDQIDSSFYTMIEGSVNFFGLDTDVNGNTESEELIEYTDASSAWSSDGSAIRDALSNIQSQGVTYAEADVRQEVTSDAFRTVRFLDWDININNLVFNNMVRGSIEDKTNIYEDEMRSMVKHAETAQLASVSTTIPGAISADEYEITIEPVWESAVDATAVEDSGKFNEGSYPIGFYVEKLEIAPDGSRIEHPPLIVDKYGDIQLLDTAVRYGGSYIYNVKTVCLTRFEAVDRDDFGEVEDQVVTAVVMVASDGRTDTVECVENVPPGVPTDIKFIWDYGNDNLMILWDAPMNPQRDVTRYQVFRRASIDVPFTLIAMLDFDQSTSIQPTKEEAPEDKIVKLTSAAKTFRDLEFTKESKYIYSVCAVDARGLTSNYSAQFMVSFDKFKNKVELDLISSSGAPKPYPNLYLNTDLFVDTMRDSGHSRLRVFFDPEYYKVFKNQLVEVYDSAEDKSKLVSKSVDLNFLPDGAQYKLQIINVDDQMSSIVNINIDDQSGPPLQIGVNRATVVTLGLENAVVEGE
jgi:hypothetical protein